VKLFSELDPNEYSEIQKQTVQLMNAMHQSMPALFEFVLLRHPGNEKRKLCSRSGWLKYVLSIHPFWWTPIAKATIIVRIVFGVKFLHRFRMVYRGRRSSDILFDEYLRIQLQTWLEINLIRVKTPQLPAEFDQNTKHLRYLAAKNAMQR
jgi:hypothetical protein